MDFTHHTGDGSTGSGCDSRSNEVITTAGALGQIPVGQECRLGNERGSTSRRLLLLCGLVDRGEGTHVDLEVLLLQVLVYDMLAACFVDLVLSGSFSSDLRHLASRRRIDKRIRTVLSECDLRRAVDSNESVLVRLLAVFIDKTAGQHAHLVTIQHRDVGESSGLDVVATVLGEEHRNVGVGKVCNERTVAGLGERRVTTPFLLYR